MVAGRRISIKLVLRTYGAFALKELYSKDPAQCLNLIQTIIMAPSALDKEIAGYLPKLSGLRKKPFLL